MKKYLIVSGCSFTTNDFISLFHPNMKCDWPKWPEILANKLGMGVINLGKSGSGNEYIFSTLIDQLIEMDHNEIGLVIPAWSSCTRRDWRHGNKWANLVEQQSSSSMKGDLRYHIDKSLRYYYMFQLYCESNNIPYKQVQMIEFTVKGRNKATFSILDKKIYEDQKSPQYLANSIYYDKINAENFLGYPILTELDGFDIRGKLIKDKFKLSPQDDHPSMEGHRMIASFIHENL